MSPKLTVGLICSYFASVHAECGPPLYGDSPAVHTAMVPAFKNIATVLSAASGEPASSILQNDFPAALQEACEAKLSRQLPDSFKDFGISRRDLDEKSASIIAIQYLSTKATLLDLKTTANAISVKDFVLEGKQLAEEHAKVSISGSYLAQGRAENMYDNYTAVIEALQYPSMGRQPIVPLLTDKAIYPVRRRLLECQSSPSESQVGCQVVLRGIVMMCTETNDFGVSSEAPCLNVWDGDMWPHRPAATPSVSVPPSGKPLGTFPMADPNPGAQPPR